MSEREEREARTAAHQGSEEERLRSLFTAAYLPLDPSEALQRRVAAVVAEREAQRARHSRWWVPPLGWGSAISAMAATALLVVLGWMLVRWHHGPGRAISAPTVVVVPRLPAPTLCPPPPMLGEGGLRRELAQAPPLIRAPTAPRVVRRAPRLSAPSPSIGGGGQRVGAERDDLAFINPDPQSVTQRWAPLSQDDWAKIEARVRRQVRAKDDFIQIPFPRLATTSNQQIAEAVEQYKKEAAVVDPRLAREVTLAFKGTALSDLCDQLHAQTGIPITAGRSVADEKVTIFCEKTPLRQVMREINRLFGYAWLRSGKAGEFKYELEQDLRSQLLEEELRNRDRDAALLALDAQMQQYRPYLDEGFDQLQQQWGKAGKRPGLGTLSSLMMDGIWGAAQLYFRLSPRDRAALTAGQELVFRPDAPDSDHRLPAEWQRPILESWNTYIAPVYGRSGSVRVADIPGIEVSQVRLQINRSELGQVSLNSRVVAVWTERGRQQPTWLDRTLASGRSGSLADPDNATANAAVKRQPPFNRTVSLHPEVSCPVLKRAKADDPGPQLYSVSLRGGIEQPHVFSSDVWEAVHRTTGLPVVADFYTRLYPLNKVTVEKRTLFEALCTAGDVMGVRWRKDGDFLLGRSASYFWDDLKEVPNRCLRRWARDRDASGGLPLADLLEMATMSDQQLDSTFVGEGIGHCWGLPEWWHLSAGPLGGPTLRPYARFLAMLTPEQLGRAQQLTGLPFQQLTPAQQQAAMQLLYRSEEERDRDGYAPRPRAPEEIARSAISVVYIPAGWYAWTPWPSTPENPYMGPVRPFGGRTPAEALAAVRRIKPPVEPAPSLAQVQLSKVGVFAVGINPADRHWGVATGPLLSPAPPPPRRP